MCCISISRYRCTCPSLINMTSILCSDCSREAISSSSCMLCALVRTGALRRFPVVGSASCSSSVKALAIEAHLLAMCVCRTPCSHAHKLSLPVQCCNVPRDTAFTETHLRTPVCLGRYLWCMWLGLLLLQISMGRLGPFYAPARSRPWLGGAGHPAHTAARAAPIASARKGGRGCPGILRAAKVAPGRAAGEHYVYLSILVLFASYGIL